jgi:SAM-dependent methyltransferase
MKTNNEKPDYRELLLGCGHSREKKLGLFGRPLKWQGLTTLDYYPECEPDYLCDLNETPWRYREVENNGNYNPNFYPLPSDSYDEVHAYEVLEHLGRQGNAKAFFETFSEIYRILKPDGYLFATCPSRTSPWLWGDPSHTRAIQTESLAFLDQAIIHNNRVHHSPMSDFTRYWTGDLQKMRSDDNGASHIFCLQAKKPVRSFA